MTRIALPPDLDQPLLEQARRLGTTPELLAVESLRQLFAPQPGVKQAAPGDTLFDFLSGHVGTVSGASEPLSEDGSALELVC